jgi:hypothetical protein
VKDLDRSEHLCSKCEREKAEATEERFQRGEVWSQAASLINGQDWPEDGKPCPPDVLKLAKFLVQEDDND